MHLPWTGMLLTRKKGKIRECTVVRDEGRIRDVERLKKNNIGKMRKS